MYYFPNGVKKDSIENINDLFIYFDSSSQKLITGKSFKGENYQELVNGNCISLYDVFLKKIFSNTDEYYDSLLLMPMWVKSVGHDSDFGADKAFFERTLNGVKPELNGVKQELIFKHLYYADCANLVGYLQSRIVGTRNSLAMFYINLANCEPLPWSQKTTTIWMAGENTTGVFSLLVDFIVSIYAILDITTKICYQLEHIPSDFSGYPSLASSIQYGNYKRIKKLNFEGTVFESNVATLKLIENLRHELIHNGYWESVPKIFVDIIDGKINSKWILMPDEISGNLVAFKNRKRFYSQNIKMNEKLLSIYSEFLERMLNTTAQLKSCNL